MEIPFVCHVHSDWSYDGRWTLPELVGAFRQRHYRALLMTEHDLGFSEERWQSYKAACMSASSPELLVMPGMEYSDPSNLIHILVWGCTDFLGSGLSTEALLAAVEERGGLAVLAHPARREAWQFFDHSWAERLAGVELWNRKTDGWAPSRSAAGVLAKTNLLNFAGLDFHDRRQLFPLSMRAEISGEICERAILDAIRSEKVGAYAFGQPLTRLTHPPASIAFAVAEGIRRPLAKAARRVSRVLSSGKPNLTKQAA